MHSRGHAILSILLGGGLLVIAPPSVNEPVLLIVVLTVGVGIDIDHFLIARLRTGSWHNLRRVLANPTLPFVNQAAIFDAGDVGASDRLLSHLLLSGVAVSGLWLIAPYWAGVTAVTLYVHITIDVYSDIKQRGKRVETPDPEPASS